MTLHVLTALWALAVIAAWVVLVGGVVGRWWG